ncbi:transglutaminase-like domain-containing protein [Dyella sp. C11]|uniref:transglutaminase-like domain-containing protein n=1 Tax=Dyella sp. C11 TaxID=2126991 RepID=UPI00130022F0|nr:transglutaminase-like domain-containing protein [Dyella sp. C11]
MRKWPAALAMALALSPAPGVLAREPGAAPVTDTTWMAVTLAGRKIGHLRIDRQVDGAQVTTTQDLQLELNRSGKTIPMAVLTRSVETLDGQPLGFYSRSTLSASDSIVDGQRQADGTYLVTTTVAGVASRTALEWPAGALLSDGQRQAMARASGHAGHYLINLFDTTSQDVAAVDIDVLGDERVVLPEGTESLNHQREVLQTPRGVQRMDLWINERGETRKGSLEMLGHELDMVACSQACAMAPTQDIDMLRAAMIDAPQALSAAMRRNDLRYVIHVNDGDAQPAITTDEQRVTRLEHGDWQVDVGNAVAGGQPPPRPQDTEANAWVQSDAPDIRALADQAITGAEGDRQKMVQLRDFVSEYIPPNGRDIGYASALEVVKLRSGDCKEYAVLLTALARAEHIPARMVTGLVYADRYAGSTRVFVPHAWVQAWVDGRWQSFDAALGHFDSTHIALDSGDGDPWHFFNMSNLFGQMRIAQVGTAPELAPTVMGGAVAARDW